MFLHKLCPYFFEKQYDLTYYVNYSVNPFEY